MNIAKTYQEIKKLGVERKVIETELVEEIKDKRENAISDVTSLAIVAVKESGFTNIDGEKENALKASISKLVKFLEKGGEVDFIMPDDDADDEGEESEERAIDKEHKRIMRQHFEQIRLLKEDVRQLRIEHQTDKHE